MSKNNIIFLIFCIIILLISGCFFYLSRTNNSYYAVYLKTGDLYFGHFSIFPSLILTDVYYIQKNTTDNTLGLEKFTNSIFDPENKINISRDNIVWTTKLREDSQVVKAIKQGVTTTTDQTQIKTTESK
ncbi:MAG TPA: hypothetical protein PLD14_00780 [Candidatus Pacearchaeota archaeon]|nr:hypothetical protein [Candidatus Pacearchaeota archaeon]HPR79737.1 hypothetical protein [Candidatus Pacearchaeota archaeon]